MASRGSGARNKGANYERQCAKKIEEVLGVKLERTPLSGGFSKSNTSHALKGDINTINPDIDLKLHIECKNQKQWRIKNWWQQTTEECPEGKIPLLLFHENYVGDYVMLKADDFFDIVDRDKLVKER